MRQFLLVSHGMFSKGIYDSVKIILGEQSNVKLLTAYVEPGVDVKDQVKELLDGIPEDDEVIVCSDVFGGSVNNEFMNHLNRKNLHLVTGMNLPLLMTMFLSQEEDVAQMIRQCVIEAKEGLIYCNDQVENVDDEEF